MLARLLGNVSLDTRHVLAISLPSCLPAMQAARGPVGMGRSVHGVNDASNQRFQAVCDGVGPGSARTEAGSQRTCLRSIEGVS